MKMAKRPVPLYDFKAFGAAIKAARNEYGESRKKVSDELYISPRYLANIENKGQQPSLQVFYDLVTRYHISVDQFFFPNSNAEKSTGRRQLDALLDGMSDKGIRIVRATPPPAINCFMPCDFAPGLSLPYPSMRLMPPQMPSPAPSAITKVCNTSTALLKKSI